MAFPTLSREPLSVKETKIVPMRIDQAEDTRYTIPTKTGTKVIKKWEVTYGDNKLMTQADKTLVDDYYETYYGTNFLWTNPETGVEYTVFFLNETLELNPPQFKMPYYEGSYIVQEVGL